MRKRVNRWFVQHVIDGDMKKAIMMIFVAGVLASCGESPQKGAAVHSVMLTTPVSMEGSVVKKHSGIVREAHTINLGFKTAGQIERIHVAEGDFVHKGQLLAELDDADYQLGVDALQIQYDQLKDEVARTEQLYRQKSISANDYEKATAGLRQLGVQLQANKNKLKYTKLYAPTDGYVQTVNFSPAEMVDAGTALLTLLDVSRMEVVADIPVDEYQQRDRFTRYFCRAAGSEGELPMQLLSLTPKADGNQLYQLRLSFVGQPAKQLTAGMNVEVGIVIADTAAATGFVVPLCAVFRDGDTSCVWVLGADSTLVKQPVELDGMDAQGRAVIREGLTGSEEIVRAGVGALQEGEKVRVIERPSKTNVGGLL